MNLDRFCKDYEITFKTDGFVDAIRHWPQDTDAADWRNEFEDNESVLIRINARDVTSEEIIASDGITLWIDDLDRPLNYDWDNHIPSHNCGGGGDFDETKENDEVEDDDEDGDVSMDTPEHEVGFAKQSCLNPDRFQNKQTLQTCEGIGAVIKIWYAAKKELKIKPLGTGVFVSDKYIMTAKHVLRDGQPSENLFFFRVNDLLHTLTRSVLTIIWDHREDYRGSIFFEIANVYPYGDNSNDFAVCSVARKWNEYSLEEHGISFVNFDCFDKNNNTFNDAMLGLPIRIDGYSKKDQFDAGTGSIRTRDATEFSFDCKMIGDEEVIPFIPTKITSRKLNCNEFGHNVDISSGTSGAPIFVCDKGGWLIKKDNRFVCIGVNIAGCGPSGSLIEDYPEDLIPMSQRLMRGTKFTSGILKWMKKHFGKNLLKETTISKRYIEWRCRSTHIKTYEDGKQLPNTKDAEIKELRPQHANNISDGITNDNDAMMSE